MPGVLGFEIKLYSFADVSQIYLCILRACCFYYNLLQIERLPTSFRLFFIHERKILMLFYSRIMCLERVFLLFIVWHMTAIT